MAGSRAVLVLTIGVLALLAAPPASSAALRQSGPSANEAAVAEALRADTMARVRIYLPRGESETRCGRVRSVSRTVAAPAVLRGAMQTLLRGPTASERRQGYGGWFSSRTAGYLRGINLVSGVARIDFRDFRRIIPGASSSCGSALLLAQLNRTATQFPTVRRAVYSFNGNVNKFYEWLQRSAPPH
jgi:hypothetical protein